MSRFRGALRVGAVRVHQPGDDMNRTTRHFFAAAAIIAVVATQSTHAQQPGRTYKTLAEAIRAATHGHYAPTGSDAAPVETTSVEPVSLTASIRTDNARFGYSVAFSGDTAVVGAPFESFIFNGGLRGQAGAVYIFVRDSAGEWTEQARLTASNPTAAANFGKAVAISGDTLVVGAPGQFGTAYVFIRSGSAWSQPANLTASNPDPFDAFGTSVAVSGDTIVVGAYAEDSGATGVNGNGADDSAIESGAAYMFVRNGTTWSQQAYLKASNTDAQDNFGFSVGISGETVVVGAFRESSNFVGVNGNEIAQSNDGASQAGAAYVFVRTGETWSQQTYLKASNTGIGDGFGYSVAVSGDTVVVGAYGEDSGPAGEDSVSLAGAAYVFVRSDGSWDQQAFLKASNVAVSAEFGYSVAISGQVIVVGAPEENGTAIGSGAAYAFVRSGTTWSQRSYLKASNPGTRRFVWLVGHGIGQHGAGWRSLRKWQRQFRPRLGRGLSVPVAKHTSDDNQFWHDSLASDGEPRPDRRRG